MASVQRLLSASNDESEYTALSALVQLQDASNNFLRLDVLETKPSTFQNDEDPNVSHSLLEDFLLYLICRKFRAPEEKAIDGISTTVHWMQRDYPQSLELEKCIEKVHDFLLASKWNAASLSTLNRIVKRLQGPQTRQRVVSFGFQIIRQSLQLQALETRFVDEASRFLLLGLSDLWSAIRNDSAKAAADIAFEFASLNHIEHLIDKLLGLALGSRSVSVDKNQVTAWTEQEGALLALSSLLRAIQVVCIETNRANVAKTTKVKDDLNGFVGYRHMPRVRYQLGSNGHHTLTSLPRCLVQTLKPTIYQCLRHDQPSVRELAAQCLAEYASLSEESSRLLIFQDVITKLNRIKQSERTKGDSSAEGTTDCDLLNAFEAEGLLDVVARIIPYLPSTFLLKHWKFIFTILENYVMHIASSVRQKCSIVVLALTKPPLVARRSSQYLMPLESSHEASLHLIVQILSSFSQKQKDGNRFGWQEQEGRLLIIDLLVNVLSQGQLVRSNKTSKIDFARQRVSLTDVQSLCWLQALSPTWVQNVLEPNHDKNSTSLSLLDAIEEWIEKNRGQNELPGSKHAFWQHVLSGWITQTKEALEATQFELCRIARQLVPGLMRLVIWTDELAFVSLTTMNTGARDTLWSWTCVKYILLHLRTLDENIRTLPNRFATNWKIVWNLIISLKSNEKRFSIDEETIVAQVEGQVMAFLSFGAHADSRQAILELFDDAVRTIHEHIPTQMTDLDKSRSKIISLDRQFCTFLVPLLPALVAILQYVTEGLNKGDTNPSAAGEQCDENPCTSLWLCLEHIVLAWLLCDDMFRWITLTKSEAQSYLLETLTRLLHISKPNLSATKEKDDLDNILQILHDTFIHPQAKNTRLKDKDYMNLLEIYLKLWLRSSENGNCNITKIILAISKIYTRRLQELSQPDAGTTFACSSMSLLTKSWDDWDNDEDDLQQTSIVQELQSVPDSDTLFDQVLKSLDSHHLTLLCEKAQAVRELPPQMYQQMEACRRIQIQTL